MSRPVHCHGLSKAKGCSHIAATNFTKLFPASDCPGVTLNESEAAILGGPGGVMHDFDGESPDSPIPAGYTFFAQFIDHDITLDTTSKLRGTPKTDEEISALPNIRSPSLDMDCVYGFGPEASPHIYDPDRPGRIVLGKQGQDLARSPDGTALIGDPRNDENIFVSQMQLMFQKFHNRMYEVRHPEFEKAQEETRFHYQWLVLFDFLKRLCDRDVYRFAVHNLYNGQSPKFYKKDAHGRLAMPVEFSVGAYRVGHTMVRSVYAANHMNTDIELFDLDRFGTSGFTEIPPELVVDWRYLLPVEDCVTPRFCKGIDALLADEIQNLPVVPSNNPNDRALAFRNLMRGNSLSLPSGQQVADKLRDAGYPVGCEMKAEHFKSLHGWDRLEQLDTDRAEHLANHTPLFLYILHESKVCNDGSRLGPTGSAILLEVFCGMLEYCHSFVNPDKSWQPDGCVSKERLGWWSDKYKDSFNVEKLIEEDDYFPFELADVVRFVEAEQ